MPDDRSFGFGFLGFHSSHAELFIVLSHKLVTFFYGGSFFSSSSFTLSIFCLARLLVSNTILPIGLDEPKKKTHPQPGWCYQPQQRRVFTCSPLCLFVLFSVLTYAIHSSHLQPSNHTPHLIYPFGTIIVMSWECFSRRKKSNADQVPRSRSAPALQTTFAPHSLEGQILAYGLSPTSKTSRIRCLSRIEKVFFTPSPSSQLKSSRAVSNPSRNRSVWCITSYTGAPALEVSTLLSCRSTTIF